jgi:BirA family biotin operon repressor/biotin-[acetyl-CoA-carboxylase] ligase
MPTQNLHEIRIVSGYKIYHYNEVSSTNDVAKEIAKKTKEPKTVIIAETQTYARGRHRRHWVSPRGGIWLSILLRPRVTPEEATKLTFITATAVAGAIQNTLGLATEVKWPNDVLFNRRKLCGILTEASIKENAVEYVVVGIGINANIDLQSFPNSLQKSVTTLKHELGYEINCETLTNDLIQSFDKRYKRLQKGMWGALLQEWRGLAKFLGGKVVVTSFAETLVGKALDVDADGALIIELQDGVLKKVVAGDVKQVVLSTRG